MCFSVAAGFGAGAVLSVAGPVAITGAQTKAQRLFAAIPFIFSLQQFAEGMLWLSIKNEGIQSWESFLPMFFLSLPWWSGRSIFHLPYGFLKKTEDAKKY